MKLYLLSLLCCAAIVSANHRNDRVKRQIGGYRFPGPRSAELAYKPVLRASARADPQYESAAESSAEYRASSQAAYRSQPAPQSYASSYSPQPAPYRQPQTYSAPRQTVQSFGFQPEKPAGNAKDANEYTEEDAEKDKQPTKLELLLAQSKFSCSKKKDGYYADNSVGCQVFHYCVGGAKHSWMCPESTVFHQVHLNCVPASQDICAQSEKYHVVNDYLHKALEQKGPNNTILYAQRYYPDEFLGDIFSTLPQGPAPTGRQTVQSYPPQAPRTQSYPQYNSASSEDDDIYGGNQAAPASQPQSYPSYNPNYHQSQPQSKPERAAARPVSYAPSSYQPQAAARAPAPAAYQPTYSSQSYPQYAPAATKPVSTTSYQPSVNYASQPTYKKVSAASVAPVAPKQPSYAQPQSYSPYTSSYPSSAPKQLRPYQSSYAAGGLHNKASSSLVEPALNLKAGVTYSDDDY